MSALGHKRTFRTAIVMSALPPKADMCSALAHVRFVPIADIRELIRASRKNLRLSLLPLYHLRSRKLLSNFRLT